MQVYLIHHADAVAAGIDPQRPLSARGRMQAEWLAEQVKAAGFAAQAIWHSGKLRARQTAEPFLIWSPFAEFRMIRGLGPDDPPELVRDTLVHETRDVLLVGHMPNISALASLLAPQSAGFPAHGLIAFERQPDGGWSEVWRAQAPM